MQFFQTIHCLVALIFMVTSSPIEKFEETLPDEYRLPENSVTDLHYRLQLTLEVDVFEKDQFSGDLQLKFTVLEDTQEIKLHIDRIKFQNITLSSADNSSPIQFSYTSDDKTEIVTFSIIDVLLSGNQYIFHFVYTADLRTDSMFGLYKSSYQTRSGEERFLATTQFQTTYARRVFPCFDEPSFKGVFDIRVKHPTIYNVRGNTRADVIITDFSEPEYKTTVLAPTPIMSTYLVALIISDFSCTRGDNIEGGIQYQVCSRAESALTRQVAVDIGPKLIWTLEEFTNVKYSVSGLTKLDQFAIPDFSAGAMENWGIATYRETALLWDPEESTNDNKQRIEAVIAHELAHMWFGDLVTTHWWSDTFLNEGFAAYFQAFALAAVETDWDLDKQFVIEALQGILVTDALITSHALSHPASTQAEVLNRFSSVSYSKGASIIRMVEHFMGTGQFKTGINQYLVDNQFGNVKPEHLWTALEKHISPASLPANVGLAAVMKNWIENPGFPLLDVKINDQGHVIITQKRFLSNGSPRDDEQWYVPITYTLSTDTDKFLNTATREWLHPDLETHIIVPGGSDWIVINNQQTGYYRVNYDDALWRNIITALNKPGFDGISAVNRAQIVNDVYNLASVGLQPYSRVFQLFSFLNKDTSYFPWYSAFSAFSNMLSTIGNENLRRSLSDYIENLMGPLYNSAPFNQPQNTNQIYTLKRALAVNWACRLGFSDCISHSEAAFRNYRSTEKKPDTNLRSVIYCSALRSSTDRDDWDFLWQKYLNSTVAAEKSTILTALGCSSNADILREFLGKSIDINSGVRQQDALAVFSAVYSGNPEGVDIAFDFLAEYHQEIANYYGSFNSLTSVINGLAGRFTRADQIQKLSDFIETATNLDPSLVTTAQAAVASATSNLASIEHLERELTSFFLIRDAPSSAEAARLSMVLITLLVTTFFIKL